MKPKVMRVGVMPREEFKVRTIAIAKGELKPSKTDPKVWFDSAHTMAQVLNNENRRLLTVIDHERPTSVKALSLIVGRSPGNVSRTLKTMQKYGIAELRETGKGTKRPVALATAFQIQMGEISSESVAAHTSA
jgi:predicted transcriptional regulator